MKVNIIIPTYKRFDSLKRTMKSIRESNYENTHTIIIMDGFKDGRYERFRDEKTEVRQNTQRMGWIYSMNETLRGLCVSPLGDPLDEDEW